MKIEGKVRKTAVDDGPYGVQYELAIGSFTMSEIAEKLQDEYFGQEVILIVNHKVDSEQ